MANKWTNFQKDIKNTIIDFFPYIFKKRARRLQLHNTLTNEHKGQFFLHRNEVTVSPLGVACEMYRKNCGGFWVKTTVDNQETYGFNVRGMFFAYTPPSCVSNWFGMTAQDVLKIQGLCINDKPIQQIKNIIRRI